MLAPLGNLKSNFLYWYHVSLFHQRFEKLRLEIEASRRQREYDIHPLDVLDNFYHEILELQLASLQKEHPMATREELLEILQKNVDLASRLSEKRRRVP